MIMKNNKLFYLQTWYCDGFQLEVPIEACQLNNLSDIHLSLNKEIVLAQLQFKEGSVAILNGQNLHAHCYTLCPAAGEKKHVATKIITKPFVAKCYPSSQIIYHEQLHNKKDRMATGELFFHYFECSLEDVYQQLYRENPAVSVFQFKHCSVISVLTSKKTNPITQINLFTRKN
jgi:hypothetical protein